MNRSHQLLSVLAIIFYGVMVVGSMMQFLAYYELTSLPSVRQVSLMLVGICAVVCFYASIVYFVEISSRG
ncbi:hypothetical protein [His 1 virus]|uniref:Putative transmembrane protein ORF34 n=1 Tax=His1 virus (isolate Australia/Victoria) TaxID=654912 RepID=Y034_HIS1I|nr:hypothetical protein His1V_gp34 [His 1 virus]Q25BG1.1 RecName: Full=Putative transmembrane protein ORF34 [His1 virus (isolate Victoria)]AAQ13761.1 hypothetical protein [His 1 virus]